MSINWTTVWSVILASLIFAVLNRLILSKVLDKIPALEMFENA